jgi:hypothetical protein
MKGRASAVLAGVLMAGIAVAAHIAVDVPVHWAVLIALPAGAVAFAGGLLARTFDTHWDPAPEPSGANVTVRATVLAERLDRAAVDQHSFVFRVQPRLHRIATAALGPDLNTEEAKQRLGPELHHLLTAPDARLPPPTTFAVLMRRLEDLC